MEAAWRNGPGPGAVWGEFQASSTCSGELMSHLKSVTLFFFISAVLSFVTWLFSAPGSVDEQYQYSYTRGLFPCPQCNKVYQYKYTLGTHLRYECGKEPQFQCPYCPHRSKLKGNLMKHVRKIHANLVAGPSEVFFAGGGEITPPSIPLPPFTSSSSPLPLKHLKSEGGDATGVRFQAAPGRAAPAHCAQLAPASAPAPHFRRPGLVGPDVTSVPSTSVPDAGPPINIDDISMISK